MKRGRGIVIVWSCMFLMAWGATPKIQFDKTTHDFGVVSNERNISYGFRFTNVGDAPLILTRVSATCGCTTPNWPRMPIAPGESSEIKVIYSARTRHGAFRKAVSVYSNGGNNVLFISGTVVRNLTPEKAYPVQLGDLRLKKTRAYFGYITRGQTKSTTLSIYNGGNKEVALGVTSLPRGVTAEFSAPVIPALQRAELKLTYKTTSSTQLGKGKTSFFLTADKRKLPVPLTIESDIEQDFSHLSEKDKQKAPKIFLSNKVIEIGELVVGASQTQEITITNRGQSNLLIHRIYSLSGENILVSSKRAVVKAGKSISLSITVKASKKGFGNYTVSIISNDPNQPVANITLRAIVRE